METLVLKCVKTFYATGLFLENFWFLTCYRLPNVPSLYTLKTSENEMEHWARMGWYFQGV